MKLYAIQVGDAIGSFAPIELLKDTKSEIGKIVNLKPENLPKEKRADWEKLVEQLKQAKIFIVEAKLEKEVKLYD